MGADGAGAILVVEDDPRVQDVLQIQLKGLGYDVLQASDGLQGLEMFRAERVEAVILDINLPGMNGKDVLDEIRNEGRNVPVIVLTGYNDLDLAVDLMGRGAFYYLTKPVNRKQLQTQLGRAAEHLALVREKERLAEENRRYQEHLEQLVEERTEELRKRTQQLLDLRDALASADKADSLELVISSVVHEVKNPLTVISSYVELLGANAGGEDGEILGAMGEACDQIKSVLNQLRDLSSQRPFKLERFELREVVESLVALTRVHCIRARVEVRAEQGCDGTVHADRQRLQQVLLNLILNACHAMPQGGPLTLRTYDSDEPGYVMLDVTDTGVGIPPDHHAEVLRPFFSTKGDKGTGLGLSISREIVEQHGGYLVVDSDVGRGTRMSISLPRLAAIEEAEPPMMLE